MGVEVYYEKGFCFMLILFSYINVYIGFRFYFIFRIFFDTLIVLSRVRLGLFFLQDFSIREVFVFGIVVFFGLGCFFRVLLFNWNQGFRLSLILVFFFQKTGNVVRVIGRLFFMVMILGFSGRKFLIGLLISSFNVEKLEFEGKEFQEDFF